MKKIYFYLTLPYLLITIFASNSAFSKDINWNLYKSNSFLWGQTTGCFLRFKFYANESANNNPMFKENQILALLNNNVGNIESYLNQLYQLGEESGHFAGMNKSQFTEMIKQISKEELKNNMAWLQTLTCMKALKDQNFIK